MLASSIINRATDILQDQTSVRWPVVELCRWLSDAQRSVIKVRPDSMNTMKPFRCELGTRQNLLSTTATGGLTALSPIPAKLIEITRNLAATSAKKAVRLVPREILDAQTPGWHGITASVDVIHYMFDPRDPETFYVYPPATTAAELEVMYSAYPTDIVASGTLTDWSTATYTPTTISLPDIYADDLLNLVLFRAYSKDSEYAGNAERAAGYLAMVKASLGEEIAATIAVQPQMKPGMKA